MQRYFTILLLLSHFWVAAQDGLSLSVRFTGSDSAYCGAHVTWTKQHPDSVSLNRELFGILLQLNRLSYLNADLATLTRSEDSVFAVFTPGESCKWIRLSPGNVEEDVLSAAGFRPGTFRNRVFNPERYADYADRILQVMETSGYPFATVKLDSIVLDSSGITASWNLQQGPFISFDTLELIGNARVKKWYLNNYLGIKNNAPYNEALIANASTRISQLPFLTATAGSKVYFYADKAMPLLYVDNRKASSVDGIIGFAPDNQNKNGDLLVTGEANLKLQNLFETGKSLDINYRSFLGNSQDLKVKLLLPYLFRTRIAFDYELAILKQDTSFLDVQNEFGIQYRFIGTDYIRFFYNLEVSSLISVDTNRIAQTGTLPESNDLRNDQYGLSVQITRYDYYLNPRKGFSIDFSGSIGEKEIRKNPTVDAVRLTDAGGGSYSVYDSVKLRSVQYRFSMNTDCFVPVFSAWALRFQVRGGLLQAEQLFSNELFRIGGIRTLKGFDEQSIFADKYVIANTELRYLLQKNAHFMLFWNGAYYENVVRTPVLRDRPFGFGAGLNFETKAGVFSLFYALGKAFNNPIEFSKAKIHFGFVNYF